MINVGCLQTALSVQYACGRKNIPNTHDASLRWLYPRAWPPNTDPTYIRALGTALMVGLILTSKRQSFEAQDTRSRKQAGNYRVKSSDFFFITVNFLPPGRTKSYAHPRNHGVWFSCVRLMRRYHPTQQWLHALPLCLRWQTRRRARIKAKPVTKKRSSVHCNPTLTWLLFKPSSPSLRLYFSRVLETLTAWQ